MAGRRKKVSVKNLPQDPFGVSVGQPLQVTLSMTQKMREQDTPPAELDDPFILNQSSSFLDPAEQVLLAASESKVRRKKEETRMELEKIQERIDYTLTEYRGTGQAAEEEAKDVKDIDLHAVKSPEELYKLLSDVRLRTKYQQQVMLLLVGYEEALDDRERLLQSIHEFFQETQAGNTTQLLEEVAAEEIDLDQATAGLEKALKTAQSAGERLLEIKKDMGQLFSIVQAFPDTKKGRKKMEKALLKAQEEVEVLQSQLQGMQGELEGSKEKSGRLQKQLDSKSSECERLRKTATQVEQLQKTNAGLQEEVSKAKAAAQSAQAESERERQEKLRLLSKKVEVKEVVKEVVKEDRGKVQELEAALETVKKAQEQVEAKMAARESEFQGEKEALVAEHEAEVQEMRIRYEDQMKSLMEDDTFSDMGSAGEGETEEEGEEEVDFDKGMGDAEEGESGLASKSFVGRLKQDHQQREKKLRDEMSDVKSKSRKTITGLKLQLTEAQNRHLGELSSLQKQLNSLNRERASIDAEREEQKDQIASFEEARSSLEAQLAEVARRERETELQMLQLQRDLEEALAATTGTGPEKASRLMQLVNRSAQWSDHRSSTPLAAASVQQSSPFPPVLPMDEVLHSCEPSATQFDPHALPSGTPYSVVSQIPGGMPLFPGSLDESFASQDRPLGSPLQEFTTAASHTHPPNALHMLAQSRLSHHSPQMTAALSHDHPVVCEWSKAYDLVLKFRDGVVDMLSDDARFETEVEDLRSIEGATLERDQDVHGQVTQMRFSLTFILHQMEVTLQESFSKLLEGDEEEGGGGEKREGEGGSEVRDLRSTLAQLRKRLRQTEDTHKVELQESKETIANLSSKVETLRMEIASLRHSMTTPTPNEVGGGSQAMFTRLDYEHNTRQLQSAVDSERLSPTAYQRVSESMSDYLKIPTQRLARIGRRCWEREMAKRLVCEVQRESGDAGETERVVKEITSREQLKQFRFQQQMDQLREKRTNLAKTLTSHLGEMETTTQTFLIKPIYRNPRGRLLHQDLITPLPRPLPVRPTSLPRTRASTARGRRAPVVMESSGPHPSMQLVSRLVASRQETRRGDRDARDSNRMSCEATPLPQHVYRQSLTREGARTRDAGGGEGAEWQVEASRPPTQMDAPFSPLMFQAPPAIPRIMELDISRKRHPADLLGHLLPGRQFKSTTASHTLASTRTQQHSSLVQSRLVTYNSKEFLQAPRGTSSRSRSLSFPHSPSLPPISVPSRIDGPMTAA